MFQIRAQRVDQANKKRTEAAYRTRWKSGKERDQYVLRRQRRQGVDRKDGMRGREDGCVKREKGKGKKWENGDRLTVNTNECASATFTAGICCTRTCATQHDHATMHGREGARRTCSQSVNNSPAVSHKEPRTSKEGRKGRIHTCCPLYNPTTQGPMSCNNGDSPLSTHSTVHGCPP